jgi:hypothetical protein
VHKYCSKDIFGGGGAKKTSQYLPIHPRNLLEVAKRQYGVPRVYVLQLTQSDQCIWKGAEDESANTVEYRFAVIWIIGAGTDGNRCASGRDFGQ